MVTRSAPILALLACAACSHPRANERERRSLRRLPLLVSHDVLVDEPSAFPRAQPLRDALVEVLREEGFCLDDRGDFAAMLQLRADLAPIEGEDRAVVLSLDKATGVRIDEWQEALGDAKLPMSKIDARKLAFALVRKLEDSSAAAELADSAEDCNGCCAPR